MSADGELVRHSLSTQLSWQTWPFTLFQDAANLSKDHFSVSRYSDATAPKSKGWAAKQSVRSSRVLLIHVWEVLSP